MPKKKATKKRRKRNPSAAAVARRGYSRARDTFLGMRIGDALRGTLDLARSGGGWLHGGSSGDRGVCTGRAPRR